MIKYIFYLLIAHMQYTNQHEHEKSHVHVKITTPVTEVGLMNILNESHESVFNYTPSRERLTMAWAMVAFENGRGKHMWNHNVGNIGPGKTHDYYVHSNRTTYRSFDTFLNGGIAYWSTIKRCSAVLKYFDIGDTDGAAKQLKRCNYYGTDVSRYTNGLTGLYWEAAKKVFPEFKKNVKDSN